MTKYLTLSFLLFFFASAETLAYKRYYKCDYNPVASCTAITTVNACEFAYMRTKATGWNKYKGWGCHWDPRSNTCKSGVGDKKYRCRDW